MILFLLVTYVFSLTTVIEAGNSVLISSLGQYTNIEYNYSVTGPYPVSAYMFNNNQNYIDCINNNYINCVYDNLGSVVNKTNAKISNFYCGDNCYLMLYNHYQYFVKIDINTSYCAKNPNPAYNPDDDDQDCYNKYSIYFDIFFGIIALFICSIILLAMIGIGYCAKYKSMKDRYEYEILNGTRTTVYGDQEDF